MSTTLVLMTTAAWGLFFVAISLAIALGYPSFRPLLHRLHPGPRANVLRAVALAPVGLAIVGVGLCFAPKLLDRVVSGTDHCLRHAGAHPHFCLVHPPQGSFGAEVWWGLAVLVVGVLVFLFAKAARLRASSRILVQLVSTARFDALRRVWLIDTDLPVAMSVGVLRPRTLLSSGLLRAVPGPFVEAIVAHEHAHERRRDGLWKVVVDVFAFGHLPGARRALTADLELAAEQACDEEAGVALGDRMRVAEALLAMERVRHGCNAPGPAALAFGAHGLTARVESLLVDSPGRRFDRRVLFVALVGAFGTAALAADPLHHLVETIIHHVLG